MIQNMKHYAIFGVLVLALAVGCRTNVILIGGISTDRRQFCVGEELTLSCQNYTTSYEWVYPGGMIAVTAGRNARRSAKGFTATFINDTTTTLQFVVSSNMNGATLTCSDFNTGQNLSATTLEVLGTSSMICPGISAVRKESCRYIDISLHHVSSCTREYSASISGESDIISSILSYNYRQAEVLDIGIFNLTNSSVDSCRTYNVSVNVTFFDNSRIACPSVAVEPPTDSPTTTSTFITTSLFITTSSSTIPTVRRATTSAASTIPSPRGLEITIIMVVVVVVVSVLLAIGSIIIIIAIIYIKNKRQSDSWKPEHSPKMDDLKLNHTTECHDHQTTTYADISVLQNSSMSSHPRRPFDNSQLDPMEPVVYSTIQSTHHGNDTMIDF